MADLPESAAWRLLDVHEGFEVLFPRRTGDGYRFAGHSVGVEAGEAWSINYTLELDADWTTRSAHIRGHSRLHAHEVQLEADGSGGWLVNGEPATKLDGSSDIDLEGSAFTNALPVQRVGLAVGASADAPAAYVRAQDLSVERLEQRYSRLPNEAERSRYDYESPAFDTRCVLTYDESGLILDYPGIAVRVR